MLTYIIFVSETTENNVHYHVWMIIPFFEFFKYLNVVETELIKKNIFDCNRSLNKNKNITLSKHYRT